jgi:outer membrane protein assembly factor BamB
MKRKLCWLLIACSLVPSVNVALADPQLDWPHWRGPEQNGVSRETGLVDNWDPKTGKNLLWKREDLGLRSTPIVMNGKVYIITLSEFGTAREGEKVVCVDAATGKTIWEHRFNVYLSDVPAERAGWGCVTGDPETGNVYALGVCGLFMCLDGASGKVLWQHSLHEEYGLLSTYGGRTNTPVVFEDMVIISSIVIGWAEMARPAHRFMAFNKRSGQMVWFNGTNPLPYDTNYSTPVIKVLGGQMAMVFGSGDGHVWALQPRTGRQIWKYELSSTGGVNVSPLVEGNQVFMAHSEENPGDNTMGAVVALDGSLASRGASAPGAVTTLTSEKGELWRHKEIVAGKGSPIMVDGRVYFIDDRAKLWIYDAKTGKQIGDTEGRPNFGLGSNQRPSPLYADGKIYALTMDGRWWVLKPTEKGVEPIKQGRQQFLRLGVECFGSPVVSHGRIYIPTTECLFCIGSKDHAPKATSRAKEEAEPALPGDPTLAHVQVIPCEVVMQPGKTQEFKARFFSDRGQLMGEQPVEFTVASGGKITTDGKFTADVANKHQAAFIVAKSGKISGQARVRIIPPLPWKFEFSEGVVPVTWIGMRHRHIAVDSAVWKELRDSDSEVGPRAARLYEYLTFQFFNTQKPALTFDRTPPSFGAMLAYMTTMPSEVRKDPQAYFNPALKLLTDKKVLKSGAVQTEEGRPKLAAERGALPIGPSQAIYKLDDIPVPSGVTKLGVRSRGFIGPAELHDYTIEADIMATKKPGRDVGDVGLIAQGYTLAVMGTNKRLQIHLWDTQLNRMSKWVTFEAKPDVWYRMKFRAANQGDKAVLSGKVWERGSEEPKDWMLTAEDATPQRKGAPGFFGTAREPGSPFFIDNVAVTANE